MQPGQNPSAAEYWEERGHAAAESEVDAVCYPGAPPFLNRYADWSQRRAVDALLDTAGPLEGLRALDVGCGTGRWSRLLAGRGATVLGVDRSKAMLAEASRRSPGLEFSHMSATQLALSDEDFDLATAVTVVQHLEPADQPRAVAEIVRVVCRGGLILTVDRVGHATGFSERHGTYPRPRDDWRRLWLEAGAEPVASRGQEYSYPLALAALRRASGADNGARTSRRGGKGWRRVALRALVGASYATELVAERVPYAPAAHLAALYVVR